jgi:acyl-CoA thioesterase YciA
LFVPLVAKLVRLQSGNMKSLVISFDISHLYTNSQGTIFGGVILSYIDTAGSIEAHRRTKMERFVTVAMKEVIFHKPVFVGDLVSFYAETVSVGTTSITVRVIVEAESIGVKSERVRVTEAEVIYVAVDEHRQKTKILNSQH